jgi:hypothetical protein
MEFNESYVRVMTLYICDGFAPSFPMLVLCTLRERIKYGVQSYVRVRTLYICDGFAPSFPMLVLYTLRESYTEFNRT